MPRNLFDMLLLVASVLALGALLAWTALYSPARPDSLEAQLEAGAKRALIEKGFVWAEVTVSGQTATLSGMAPTEGQKNQAHDAILASARTPLPSWVRRYAGGDLPAGGFIWGGISAIVDQSTVTDVISPYLLRADTVSGGLILSGYMGSEDDRDALFIAAEAAFPGQVEAELVLAPGAPDADWLAMAEFALGVLSQMEIGAVEVSDTDVTVTGLVADEGRMEALEAMLAGAPAGFAVTSELAIGTAPDAGPTAGETPAPVEETRPAPAPAPSRPEPVAETRAPVSRPDPAPAATQTPASDTTPEDAGPEDTGPEDAGSSDTAEPAEAAPEEAEPAPIDPYELEARLREQAAAEAAAAQEDETPDTDDADTDTETDAGTGEEPDPAPAETPEEN